MSASFPGFGPMAFFHDMRDAFGHTLQAAAMSAAGIESMLLQAWDSFDGNVAIQSEGQPSIACHKGCPSCCTLRVAILAPEVFMVAAYVRATVRALHVHGIDLEQRMHKADAATRGLDEVERVALKQRCPYIERGVCLIHRVRPLTCRGHASHDKRACVEAAAGRVDEVPFSGPHRAVRILVQTALQAALRTRGLAWGAYEMNHAVMLALNDPHATQRWLAGEDPLAAAAVDTAGQRDAMAAWFDEEQVGEK